MRLTQRPDSHAPTRSSVAAEWPTPAAHTRRTFRIEGAALAASGVLFLAKAMLWCSVLLGIHRGGRTKLIALNQISRAILEYPAQAERLIPVLAPTVRS